LKTAIANQDINSVFNEW